MPRKTKETENIENDEKLNTTKKVNKSKKINKVPDKKASVSSKSTKTNKTTKTNKLSTIKETISQKKEPSKTKTSTKKNTTQKTKKSKIVSKVIPPVEYYDLPYRYNQTVVKLLAQTPYNLFIYWDISDEDRNNFKKIYGDNFFEQTKPVLIIHNKTMNYSFEVDINDFANSWYLHVNDSKCDYSIELGRRPIVYNQEINKKINNNYIYISSSNDIIAPNDKVLFNVNQENIYFKNTKTNFIEHKPISKISFMPHLHQMSKVYNVYDLYKELYKDEYLDEIINFSTGNPSSGSLSSRFI